MSFFSVPSNLYRRLRVDLSEGVEGAGFFLADYEQESRVFEFREWRAIPPSGFESRSEYHLVLTDDMRAEIIKWAWDSGSSLVEAHSHHLADAACFSPSDMYGLREWVPHLWWRLRGRQYGAIVVDGETFDGLAWIEAADKPEQVIGLSVDGRSPIRATGRTLSKFTPRAEQGHGR